jgi:DNA processing protein
VSGAGADSLPPEAYAAALAGLPGVGPARLGAILARWSPEEAWQRAGAGGLRLEDRAATGDLPARWRRHAQATDVGAVWADLRAAGVSVTVAARPGYPAPLVDDHERPAVVFSLGDALSAVDGRRVAIVGTRGCTRYGREVAYELGRDLAANGVRVVSGLALGIDGAAHSGVLAAGSSAGPPVAVVGSGLDVVYPRRHARLWRDVAAAGAILSEAPLGAAPEAWRFPVRNRIIAALAEVVVVVESPNTGGSRHTVEAAMARDRPVLAVPGPVRSPTSDLPNLLLAEGCHPARDALDVLVALDLAPASAAGGGGQADPRPPPDAIGTAVLEAFAWQPATFEQLVLASGRGPAEVGMALAHLERDGWVAGGGGWWERRAVSGSAG